MFGKLLASLLVDRIPALRSLALGKHVTSVSAALRQLNTIDALPINT